MVSPVPRWSTREQRAVRWGERGVCLMCRREEDLSQWPDGAHRKDKGKGDGWWVGERRLLLSYRWEQSVSVTRWSFGGALGAG